MPESTCPKCGSRLQEGYVPDRGRPGIKQASWVEGKPERSFWTGLKLHGRAQYPIATYRCSRCGFLESYAGAG
jgi:ribosomal protein L37E